MITFYSGTPGSGKSYHAVLDMIFKLRRNKKNTVISNIPLDFSRLKGVKGRFVYVSNELLSPDYFISYARDNHDFSGNVKEIEGQTLVVLDECQTLFNPREFARPDRLKWVNFFTMHRHLGFNFVLISQFDRLVDRQIRNNFEFEVKHRKLNNFKVGIFVPFPVFVCIEKWYGANEKNSVTFLRFKKKYGNLYSSCRDILFKTEKNRLKNVLEKAGDSGGSPAFPTR